MCKSILTIMGVLLVALGILGVCSPEMLGMHLTGVHNAIHLVSGILVLYFGLKRTLLADQSISMFIGGIYALFGLIGLIAGGARGMWVIIPGHLVFGISDNVVHLLLGSVLVFGGLYRSVILVRTHHARPGTGSNNKR